MQKRGNILFLILLAVVMFAALSYAVTSSLRGGKTMSSEKTSLIASQLVQLGTLYKSTIDRLYLVGDYAQIQFSTSPETASGNCHFGANAPAACGKTIGMFDNATGLTKLIPSEALDPNEITSFYKGVNWSTHRVQVNGIDIGTSAPDDMLYFVPLRQSVCEEINSQLYGDPALPSYTTTNESIRYYNMGADLAITTGTNNGSSGVNLGRDGGCVRGTRNYYVIILKAR